MPSLYLINPKPTDTTYEYGDSWISSADLAMVTVAAMAPPHWTIRVTEESIEPVDLDSDADFIGFTGKSAQYPRMVELAALFRARGKTILIGGPFASLDPEACRPYADILFTGEMEDIGETLFADLEAGSWRAHYDGGRADIRKSPIPRWELYPVDRAMLGALQTTRGCPFSCEFCDVIMYQGRKQRHKDVPQVLAELDALYAAGFRETFLCDDNFAVHRGFARTMLAALADFNRRHADDPMRFCTQTSIDLAREPEIMRQCRDAGLHSIFVGIETINEASLSETGKKQNLLMPTLEAVRRITGAGIHIRSGVIVGFDHDGPGIFEDLYTFFQSAPLPDLTVGVLSASIGTPLYARLQREGRLLGGRWEQFLGHRCNFIPKLMSPEELVRGTHALAHALYAPEAYERRLLNLIEGFGGEAELTKGRAVRGTRGRTVMALIHALTRRGKREAAMVSGVLAAAAERPQALRATITSLVFYENVRRYLDRIATDQTAVVTAAEPAFVPTASAGLATLASVPAA